MKPTIQTNPRRSPALPKTDYCYQSPATNRGGRCFDSRRPSIRAISQNYFKNEVRHSFATEAALFGVIVLTAAVPLIDSAAALVDLVRSF